MDEERQRSGAREESRHRDPELDDRPSLSPIARCVPLPAQLGARLNMAGGQHAVLPCLHAPDAPDVHGSGVLSASDVTESLTVRQNALTSLVPPPPPPLALSTAPQSTPLHAFRHLLALDLNHNRLRHLTGIEVLPQLLSLRVAHNELVSLSALWRAPCAARLDVLDVTGNRLEELLSDGDVVSVRAGADVPLLRVLYASDNRVRDVDNVFACFTKLQDVRLRRNALQEMAPSFLGPSRGASQPACAALRYLDVAENPLRTQTCRALEARKSAALDLVISTPHPTPPRPREPSITSPTPSPAATPQKTADKGDGSTAPNSANSSPVSRRSIKKEPPKAVLTAAPSPATATATASTNATHAITTIIAESDTAAARSPARLSYASSTASSLSSEDLAPLSTTEPLPEPLPVPEPGPLARAATAHSSVSASGEGRRVTIKSPRTGTRYSPSNPEPLLDEGDDDNDDDEDDAVVQLPPPSSSVSGGREGGRRRSLPLKPQAVTSTTTRRASTTRTARHGARVTDTTPSLALSPESPPLSTCLVPIVDSRRGGEGLWLEKLASSPAADPNAGVQKVAENTYVVRVAEAMAAFEHNVCQCLLQGGSEGLGLPMVSPSSRADLLNDPAATAAMVNRLPTMALTFQLETFDTVPTLLLVDITPVCTRPTVMLRLFLAHLLRSLMMEEEAARTRLLRSRATAIAVADSHSAGSRGAFTRQASQQSSRSGAVHARSHADGAGSAPEEAVRAVAFSNMGEEAPALRVCHVVTTDRLADGHASVAALPYLRWRREWELAVGRRKLAVDAHYVLGTAPLSAPCAAPPATVVSAFPDCVPQLGACGEVPLSWSLLYAQLVLDVDDGSAAARRHGRGRPRSGRTRAEARGRLESAFYHTLAPLHGQEDTHEEMGEAAAQLPAVTRRRPCVVSALQRSSLDAARPLTAMRVVAPRWSRGLVEGYRAVRAPASSSSSSSNNNNSGSGMQGFARSISSLSSGRSLGPRAALTAGNSAPTSAPVASSGRLSSTPLTLASHDYVGLALGLHAALATVAKQTQCEVDVHAATQVPACRLEAVEKDTIAQNRAARDARWRHWLVSALPVAALESDVPCQDAEVAACEPDGDEPMPPHEDGDEKVEIPDVSDVHEGTPIDTMQEMSTSPPTEDVADTQIEAEVVEGVSSGGEPASPETNEYEIPTARCFHEDGAEIEMEREDCVAVCSLE